MPSHKNYQRLSKKKASQVDKKQNGKNLATQQDKVRKRRLALRKFVPIVAVIVFMAGLIPFPVTVTESAALDFSTVKQKDEKMELGESKIVKVGREGRKDVKVESMQNFWGWVLGLQPFGRQETSSTITQEPVDKIVAHGTKKYQYMLCSDGSYRYYTDEQFKDPDTGFTSKSEDFCKKNGQGSKVRLSDTLTGNGTTNSDRTPTVTVRDGCTYTSIPYKTVYKDVPWLNKGETQVYEGRDGTKSSCGWSTEPKDKEILRGTSEPSSGFNPSANTGNQDYAAYERCLSSYRSAMSQIQANESQGMGGASSLKRQVESEFSRCKRAAGY